MVLSHNQNKHHFYNLLLTQQIERRLYGVSYNLHVLVFSYHITFHSGMRQTVFASESQLFFQFKYTYVIMNRQTDTHNFYRLGGDVELGQALVLLLGNNQ